MKDEPHGHNLGAHLHGEDTHEDRLQLLQLKGQDRLVVVRYPAVHGHDHAVGHDGDDNQPFKRRPGHKPNKQAPNRISGGQNEKAAGAILVQQYGSLLPFTHLGSYELKGPNNAARYTFLCSAKAMLYQPKFFMKLLQKNNHSF